MTIEPVGENLGPLTGLRILVVEDDYFIADEICSTLRGHGAEIVGPAPSVERGLQLIESHQLDCAVLDINLQGNLAFGIARELRRRGTPALFATGYDMSVLPIEFSGSIRLEKPVNLRALLRAVQSACVSKQTARSAEES